jgi:hypothetical protein
MRLCKTIAADGAVRGYDSAKIFDLHERAVSSLADLYTLFADLAGQPDRCVVRGAIADPARVRGVRRLLHDGGETGDRATLVDVPRRWVALDLDGAPVPPNHDPADVFSCATAASRKLPQEFRGAAFIAQATASHGIKPGMHLRLWAWLSRPTTGAELAHWLRGVPHLDRASFSAGQIIYASAPVFEAPRIDHITQRLCIVPGPPTVRVPPAEALRPPPPPPPRPMPAPGDSRAQRYAFAALRNAAVRISTAPVGNRHATVVRESRSLARFVSAGLISEAAARRVLSDTAAAAGKSDPREIDAAFAWGAAHQITAPLPEMTHGR